MKRQLLIIFLATFLPACSPVMEEEGNKAQKNTFLSLAATLRTFGASELSNPPPDHVCVVGRAGSPKELILKEFPAAHSKSGFDKLSDNWVFEDHATIVLIWQNRISYFNLLPDEVCCLQRTYVCSSANKSSFYVLGEDSNRRVYIKTTR